MDTTELEQETTAGLLPKLRFPEFQDAPEWEDKKLIEIASKKVKWSFIGGPFGSNLKASDYTENGIRIIQLQNIGDGEFIDNYRIFTSEQKADELLGCNIYPGDIILSKMGDPVARACLIPINHKRYVMCSDGIRLVVDEKKFNKFFIYSFINSSQFRRLADKAATGSTRKRIGIDELKNQSVATPGLSEQQKIAACLSSLDDLIAAQSQKLAALKTHKKGLMQQLFPAEGQTLPNLRFPEFQGRGEWSQKFGDKVFEQITNKQHDSSLPILAITQEYGAIPRDLIDYQVSVTKKSIEGYKVVEVSDFIISLRSFQGGIEYSSYKGICSPAYIILRKKAAISEIYFKQFFKTERFIQDLNKNIEGLRDGKMVSYKQFSELLLPVPSLKEQQKIADCLSSLDDLIAAQSQKLAALKVHKKGLMQQLFPSPEDVQA
ncbi:MAG: restriction endonuclease subunit S [Chloroflexota bacterium]